MIEPFQFSMQPIWQHLKRYISEDALPINSVVKYFFTTAANSKKYKTTFCILEDLELLKVNAIYIHPFLIVNYF
jgi:transglutaminase/protease-like cytokinesis protein 3